MTLKRCRPSSRLLWLLATFIAYGALLAVLSILHLHVADAEMFGYVLLASAMLVAVGDLVLSRRSPDWTIERDLPANLAVGREVDVRLTVSATTDRPVPFELYDDVPQAHDVAGLPLVGEIRAGQRTRLSYRLRPIQRGPLRLGQIEIRLSSMFGLWDLQFRHVLESRCRVFPDFSAIPGYQLLQAETSRPLPGTHRRQRRGEGTEFHQLRDYREGDTLRQIDWKATSRRLALVARDYQEERDQNVVLLLDSGHRMMARDEGLSHFDHALNAALMLSYVALRHGDAVGMLSFGEEQRWIPPLKGTARVSRLLNEFYDLYPGNRASDYVVAAESLMARQRKRSLVLLLTNLRGEDDGDLQQFVHLVRRRHLVVVANLREPVLDKSCRQAVTDFDDALHVTGSALFAQQRRAVQDRLRGQGVLLVDSTPRELTTDVINRYLAIKQARSL